MSNLTIMEDFILMGFSDIEELQILYAILFLLIYMTALMGNILIITLTSIDQHLSTPMYFFLKHLSVLDSCFISVTVPKSIINSVTHTRSISFLGCATQLFLVLYLAFSELVLLTVMAYDRYVAICHPLHYEVIMNKKFCVHLVVSSWLSGGIGGGMYTSSTFSLTFCGILIQQFFCDVPSLMKISCIGTHLVKTITTALIFFLALGCFISIIISYTCIFIAVLRIPSIQGRSKVFLTCLPHLLVTTLFFSTGSTPYLIPKPDNPSIQDLLLSVLYTVVPPTLNPIIYSLRNKDIKYALRKIILGKNSLCFNTHM
ncbi:PREDICTED: olfactory receptor 14A16-like [Chrysochloris asiatica]|uniref:Olfactory receptor n=1 Tax=Chrysochloris asiatica TaxID=185453 RepID=A0A9B0U7F8_CHRAS|nr:PREDICTED: olfactory receptor 14A16-like [Chrysochloris asiatica]